MFNMRTKPSQKLAEASRGRAVPVPVETSSDSSSVDASSVPVQTPSLEDAASNASGPDDCTDVNTETEINTRGVVGSDSNNNASLGTGKAPMRPPSPSHKKSVGRKKLESKYSKASTVKTACSGTNTTPVSVRSLVAKRRPADVQCYNPCKMPRPTKPKKVLQQAVAQPSQATSEATDPGMVCTYCCCGGQPWRDQHMSCAPPVPRFQPCQCCQCHTSPQRGRPKPLAKAKKRKAASRPTPATFVPRYYGPCAPICRGHCFAAYAAPRPVCPAPSTSPSAPRKRSPKKARKGKYPDC